MMSIQKCWMDVEMSLLEFITHCPTCGFQELFKRKVSIEDKRNRNNRQDLVELRCPGCDWSLISS
jgi:DNA-directed RNA polymerase subunit RPC12/RpoP